MLHGNSGSHRAAHEIFFTSAPARLRLRPRMMAASMTTRTSSALLIAIAALVVAMVSYQCGASLAKHLFPVVGAEGATAFRLGISAVLLALLLVWAADTGAYFAGRRFGTTKLAPRISPNKTRAGMWGALVVSGALALAPRWANRITERCGAGRQTPVSSEGASGEEDRGSGPARSSAAMSPAAPWWEEG